MNQTGFEAEFKTLLRDTVSELGTTLKGSLDEIAIYASARTAHLSTIVAEPGFAQAVTAERDAIALKAGISAVAVGAEADQRLLGVIAGAIRIGALALVAL